MPRRFSNAPNFNFTFYFMMLNLLKKLFITHRLQAEKIEC